MIRRCTQAQLSETVVKILVAYKTRKPRGVDIDAARLFFFTASPLLPKSQSAA